MYLGIDFSGGAGPWKARCPKPTVWIATLDGAAMPRLRDLRSVQELPGIGEPFARLTDLLRGGGYAAAGIDAPFAIPVAYMPPGGHPALLSRVAALPAAPDRPFPSGAALVAMAEAVAPLQKAKPYRATEFAWVKRGVNTRSTLWDGPRAGAPFTAACLTLLAAAQRPIWPWDVGAGLLVEAFPAAQLLTWGLPHKTYAKPEQGGARDAILAGLAERLSFTPAQRATMRDTPDALDAVLAAFAGIAAVRAGQPDAYPPDGLIAVLEEAPQCDRPETFEDLLRRPGVRVERIVSRGHTTPRDRPYVQGWDEWIMVLEGAARLELDGSPEHALAAGDHLLIPAGVPHRVTHTADPTVWLAVHLGEPEAPGDATLTGSVARQHVP